LTTYLQKRNETHYDFRHIAPIQQISEKTGPGLTRLKTSVRKRAETTLTHAQTHQFTVPMQSLLVFSFSVMTGLDAHLTQSSTNVGNQFFGPRPPILAQSLL
jgi:hypothetical protein